MQNQVIFPAQYIRQFGFSLITFLIFVPPVWPASVSQRTEGSCSPAVADVKGDVKMNIVCEGVDPALLKEIVKLLNEILQDTKKMEQIREELDKTSKRTNQIEARQAPRRLTPNRRAQLVAFLSANSGALVEIDALANDAEAMKYAMDLGYVLLHVKWKAEGVSAVTILGEVPVGLSLRIRDKINPPTGTDLLLQSFRKVGLDVILLEKSGVPADRIVLMVGAKPQ